MTPERGGMSREEIERRFVSKESFEPVKNLVYGFVTLTLIAVVTLILKLVLKP